MLFVLIAYIACTLKCEMNKTESKEKIGNVEPPNDECQQVYAQQPKDEVRPGAKESTDAREPSDDTDRPLNVKKPENAKEPGNLEAADDVDKTTAAAVEDTFTTVNAKHAVEQLKAAEKIGAVDPTDASNITYNVELPVDTVQVEDAGATNAVDITGAGDTTYATESPEDVDAVRARNSGDVTYAEEKPGDEPVEKPLQNAEKTKGTKKQKNQADDKGPSKIKVEDALKILEKSKKIYTMESIALIKKLERLRSTFNITELMVTHKIDPNEDYDDTQNSLNTSSILRTHVEDGFIHLKKAILDASKFSSITLKEAKKKLKKEKIQEEAKSYKANFIATHSDRESLEKIYLVHSD